MNSPCVSLPPANHQKLCPSVLQLPKQVSMWLAKAAKPAFAYSGLKTGAIGQSSTFFSQQTSSCRKEGGVEMVERRGGSSTGVVPVRRLQDLRGQCSQWQLIQVPSNPCTHLNQVSLYPGCKHLQALGNPQASSFYQLIMPCSSLSLTDGIHSHEFTD